MRIVHLTDLHFGAEDPLLVRHLAADVQAQQPHIVVVTGDFTQVGAPREFRAARNFLDALPGRKVLVPGNHDVPARDLLARFLTPYRHFQALLSSPTEPQVTEGDEVAIAGINSARRLRAGWNWALGSVSRAQIDRAARYLGDSDAKFRVMALHHPLFAAAGGESAKAVRRAGRLLESTLSSAVDIILCGHSHRTLVAELRPGADKRLLIVQSATAASVRRRGHANGYTVLDLEDGGDVVISPRCWTGELFETLWSERYAAAANPRSLRSAA